MTHVVSDGDTVHVLKDQKSTNSWHTMM